MPIISQETWDKFSPEEKEKIINRFTPDFTENSDYANGYFNAMRDIFGEDKLQPQTLTYEDVARELFGDGALQFKNNFSHTGKKSEYVEDGCHSWPLNLNSEKQAEKLLAINKLLNVAKFLNKDWKPDWSDSEEKKFFPALINNDIRIGYVMRDNSSIVYFRTEELAKQAVQILGEETVRLALTMDF